MENKSAQNIIDEVNSQEDSTTKRKLTDLEARSPDTNGLFVEDQETLSKISWKELKKVSQ